MKFLKDNRILEINEADPEDAAEILEFLKIVGEESDFLYIDGSGVGLTIEQEKEYLKKNLKTFNCKSFSAKVDGKIVSLAGINGSLRPKVMHNVSLGISVLKDYWNLGIATHVMNHIVNYCRLTKEIENITLEVREDNDIAMKIYNKLGFKKVGKFSKKFKVENTYYDCIIMELIL